MTKCKTCNAEMFKTRGGRMMCPKCGGEPRKPSCNTCGRKADDGVQLIRVPGGWYCKDCDTHQDPETMTEKPQSTPVVSRQSMKQDVKQEKRSLWAFLRSLLFKRKFPPIDAAKLARLESLLDNFDDSPSTLSAVSEMFRDSSSPAESIALSGVGLFALAKTVGGVRDATAARSALQRFAKVSNALPGATDMLKVVESMLSMSDVYDDQKLVLECRKLADHYSGVAEQFLAKAEAMDKRGRP